MTWAWDESAVPLDKLDDHLKALLRLKIREFVHLNPIFKETPVADPALFMSVQPVQSTLPMVMRHGQQSRCPRRKSEARTARRHVRVALHAGSLM